MAQSLPYKRVIAKFSGELMGPKGQGIDARQVAALAAEIKKAHALGVQLGIVLGAGNLIRGRDMNERYIRPVVAHTLGLVSTVLNAIAMQDALRTQSVRCSVLSAVQVGGYVERYSVARAEQRWKRGEVCIFAGGTGKPFFTTDTAVALRAVQTKADLVLKATLVDGIYTADPKKYSTAKKLPSLTYKEALEKKLEILDVDAFQLCQKSNIPIGVYQHKKNAFRDVLQGVKRPGTMVTS